MIEPQRLEYVESDVPPPCIILPMCEQASPLELPVERIIETAFTALKHSGTHSHYRKRAWDAIHCYLAASLDLSDDKHLLHCLLNHPSFKTGPIAERTTAGARGAPVTGPYRQKRARDTHQTALTGMFVAVAIKELNAPVFQTMVKVVRHYTMIAVAQQAGPFANASTAVPADELDAHVLVDALAAIMGHEEKELCKPGYVAMGLMLETATAILGGRERACKLPLVEYLAERMCSLCYERAWYTKLGGCLAIRFLFERMAPRWVYEHLFVFLKALLFVMMDLTGEVSSGAIDAAKANLERMLVMCVTTPTEVDITELEEVTEAQNKALYDVTHELVRQVTSPHELVREQAMRSLRLLAERQNKTVTNVMHPHRDVLADMIPPKKHLLRHQPANAQIGLMDGNTFCTTLEPRLFTINLTVHEHKIFVHELLMVCESEDIALGKFACYKSVASFAPLRRSALRALAACHYLEPRSYADDIFKILYKALERHGDELRPTVYECLKSFVAGYQPDMKVVHDLMKPLLNTLVDHRSLTLAGAKRLSYLTRLFPLEFNERFCEQLLDILGKLMNELITIVQQQQQPTQQQAQQNNNNNNKSETDETIEKIATVIDIFHQTPAALARFVGDLIALVLRAEKAMLIEASSPFREPLIRFLARHPAETLQHLLDDARLVQRQYSRCLELLLRHQTSGGCFREHLMEGMVPRLLEMLGDGEEALDDGNEDKLEIRYQAVRIISIMTKLESDWLADRHALVAALSRLWCTDSYLQRHRHVDGVRHEHWNEPKMVCSVLLHDLVTRPGPPQQLFQLLRAFTDRYIPSFHFVSEFLEREVAHRYPVEWKQNAFFKFAELFPSPTAMSQELKAKVLQMLLIPAFKASFEKGETAELLGGEPQPDVDSRDNVVSVFIGDMIDPDRPFGCADCVRIALLQFACLLVEYAAPYIHNAAKKQHGYKVRRLMTFAWPCLLSKSCVDPVTR